MKIVWRALILLLGSLTVLQSVYSQESGPIPIENVLAARQFPALTQVRISPDNRWVAYALRDNSRRQTNMPDANISGLPRSASGVPAFVVGSDVWLTTLKTGKARNLTGGKGSSWGPAWSPDGRRLAFYSDRTGSVRVWIWDSSIDALSELSDLIVSVNDSFEVLQWTPDGAQLLTVTSEETNKLRESAPSAGVPESTSENVNYAAAASNVLLYATQGDPLSLPRVPQERKRDLAIINLSSTRIQRFAQGFQPMWYRLSPSGKQVAFTNHIDGSGNDRLGPLADLVVVDLSDGRLNVLARNIPTAFGVNFSWAPDGRSIAYTTLQSEQDGVVKGECFVVALSGGKLRNLTPPLANFATVFGGPIWDVGSQNVYLLSSLSTRLTEYLYSSLWRLPISGLDPKEVIRLSCPCLAAVVASPATGRFWSPDGGRSMIVMTRNSESLTDGFGAVDLTTGTIAQLLDEHRSYGLIGTTMWNLDISSDSQYVLFRAQDVGHSEDVWMLRTPTMSKPERVTYVNPQLANYSMGVSKLIEWTDLDGQTIKGALLLPSGFQKGTRYPLIVDQYPGLFRSMLLNEFGLADDAVDNLQLFASRGYAVLMPDVPINVGTPMRDILNSVMPGVDKVIELGIADPSRLGVMGHSWGGYGVLSLISQTNRFKAAVSRSGVGADLISYYTSMWKDGTAAGMTETELLKTGGTLWEKRDVFIENSPVFYLDKVQTPLLLTHGTLDPVSSVFSDEIFVCMRRLAKQVEYAQYQGEVHNERDWSYADQMDFVARIIKWFDGKLQSTSNDRQSSDRGRPLP